MDNKNEIAEDKSLVLQALEGDIASLGDLFTLHRPSLYAHAISLLGYVPQSEDAVSDAFVIAMTKLHTLRKPEAFRAWIHEILSNVCRMYWRRANQARLMIYKEEKGFDERSQFEPEEFIDNLIYKDELWSAIDSLSESLQTALMLRYFTSFYSYEEISQVLRIPVGTVKSRLAEAKSKLKRRLELKGGQPGRFADVFQAHLEQAHFHKQMWQRLYQEPGGMTDYFAEDILVTYPQENKSFGLRELRIEIETDLRAESILYPENAIASNKISIVEGKIVNSPKTPFRCPPNALAILFHSNQKVERMNLYVSGHMG